MTRPSPEIEAIVRRWTDRIRSHAVADLPHFLSGSNALVYLGTADDELWRGQLVRDGIAAHMAEVPDFSEDEIEIEAFENGDTGWASYRSRFTFHATGVQGTHRVTFVFVLEKGGWKMIQHHISQADSNAQKMGIEHSAFSSLIKAAQAGSHEFGSDGLTTIMFTDIEGSTALASAIGDRLWVETLEAHIALVSDCIARHGGQVVKSLGDGTMSAFGAAHAALAAACAIQGRVAADTTEPRLQVRVGLHTGEVIKSREDFFGTVVNKAARIAAIAEPGEIRLSEAVRLMVGPAPGMCLADPLHVALKGLDGEHLIHRLEWQA